MLNGELQSMRERLAARLLNCQAECAELERALESIDALRQRLATKDDENDWSALGIVDATRKLLMENPGSYTTREIAEQLKLRGIKTNAKRFQATVYVTLKESPWFEWRDRKWSLSARGAAA